MHRTAAHAITVGLTLFLFMLPSGTALATPGVDAGAGLAAPPCCALPVQEATLGIVAALSFSVQAQASADGGAQADTTSDHTADPGVDTTNAYTVVAEPTAESLETALMANSSTDVDPAATADAEANATYGASAGATFIATAMFRTQSSAKATLHVKYTATAGADMDVSVSVKGREVVSLPVHYNRSEVVDQTFTFEVPANEDVTVELTFDEGVTLAGGTLQVVKLDSDATFEQVASQAGI